MTVNGTRRQLIDKTLLKQYLHKAYRSLRWPVTLIIVAFIISPRHWSSWSRLHVNADLTLQYIHTLIWPSIVLIAILVIRPHLPILVKNLRKLSGGKVSAEFTPNQTQEAPSDEVNELRDAQDSSEPATDINPETGVDNTVHEALSSADAKIAFQEVYMKIYGTQLSLLKRLLNNVPEGLIADQLSDLYEAHVASTDDPYPNFIGFIQFLIDNVLVVYDAVSGRYNITNAGLYFLRFLSERGLYQQFRPF